jgi:hypothetical protein
MTRRRQAPPNVADALLAGARSFPSARAELLKRFRLGPATTDDVLARDVRSHYAAALSPVAAAVNDECQTCDHAREEHPDDGECEHAGCECEEYEPEGDEEMQAARAELRARLSRATTASQVRQLKSIKPAQLVEMNRKLAPPSSSPAAPPLSLKWQRLAHKDGLDPFQLAAAVERNLHR